MADLPRGTVTFLFTDIEGSTARWERDRTAMAGAVARHFTLLDAAIAARGGVPRSDLADPIAQGSKPLVFLRPAWHGAP